MSSRTGQKRLSQATKFRHREVATGVTEGETKKREATAELARAEQEVLDVAERRQVTGETAISLSRLSRYSLAQNPLGFSSITAVVCVENTPFFK